MLMLTHSPALVWSINGRRTNFWLPTVRHVDCRGSYDPAGNLSRIDCRCGEKEAELAVFVPPGKRVAEATIDGKTPWYAPEFAGGAWFVRMKVTKGDHRIVVRYGPNEPLPEPSQLKVEVPEQITAGESVPVRVRFDATPAGGQWMGLLRVLRDGMMVAGISPRSRITASPAEFMLKIPETARPGTYQLAFNLVGSVDDEPLAQFQVTPGSWKQTPSPTIKRGKPVVKLWDVGRKIKGIDVLRAATDTFDHRGGVQIARLDVNKLTAQCGLDERSESPWGYGFAGVEVRDVKRLSVDLRNNFCKPHKDGFKLTNDCRDTFVGFIIDYHTPKGYTHRVALGLGIMDKTRPVRTPNWGKSAQPNRCIALSRTILEKPRDLLTVDLAKFAPPDWDGRAWFGIGVDTVYRGLKLDAVIGPPPK